MEIIFSYNKNKKYISIICIALYVQLISLMIGCASYETVETKEKEPVKNEIFVNVNSLNIHFVSLANRNLAMNYVGIDPERSSMLPMFIKIINRGNEVIKIQLSESYLVTGTGEICRSLSVEESIDRAKKSDAEVVAWTLALAPIADVVMLGAMHANTSANRTLEEDYHDKYFKPTLINAGGSAQGIVFFVFPTTKQTKIILAIIQIKSIDTNEVKKVSINLNDDFSK